MHQDMRSSQSDLVPADFIRAMPPSGSTADGMMGDRNSSPPLEMRPGLAQAIVDTVREPLLVLDKALRIIAASRSFHLAFDVSAKAINGRSIFEVIDRQSDVTALRTLLETILPQHAVIEGFKIDQAFPQLGRRVMLLNAREVSSDDGGQSLILLAFEDVTDRHALKHEMQELVAYKELLLEEMQHRIGNSLQIIASILMLKARSVASEEAKQHLRETHERVLSIAATQRRLQEAGWGKPVDATAYLQSLCASLIDSMVDGDRPIKLLVKAEGAVILPGDAINIGLIVTEAVINCLKYAFAPGAESCEIVVVYERSDDNWLLSIADNGVGMPSVPTEGPKSTGTKTTGAKSGLGTTIINALASRLKARVEIKSSATGTTLCIIGSSAA